MSADDHNKVLVNRCWCGAINVRVIVLQPHHVVRHECRCGTRIDWAAAPVEDHLLFVWELLGQEDRQ